MSNLIRNTYYGQKTQYIGELILKIGLCIGKDGLNAYSFTEPFPNECFIVLATENDGVSNVQVHMENWFKNEFRANCVNPGGGAFYFLAIGH